MTGKTLYEWNDAKALHNLEKHGVPFEAVYAFDWDNIVASVDERYNYGETRFIVLGRIGQRVHTIVYTRRGDTIRLISLRRSNAREIRFYERHHKTQTPGGL